MRSGGNVSTGSNNSSKVAVANESDVGDEKVADTSRCKGATTIPIFLKSALFCLFVNLICSLITLLDL